MNIPFESKEHQMFFYSCLNKAKNYDLYHQALFYTMGISETTRARVSQWFDFKENHIKREVLEQPWQTGGTRRLTRMAFNLWNGYDDGHTTPYDLFDCGYGKYMLTAIQLRYPEYCLMREQPKVVENWER